MNNTPWNRRSFLKLLSLGGISALCDFTSCERPQHTIFAPKTDKTPELSGSNIKTALYATTNSQSLFPHPLLVSTVENRPIMISAPNESPWGVPTQTTAALWDLYSPNRSTPPLFHQKAAEQTEFSGAFQAWARHIRSGKPTAIVISPQASFLTLTTLAIFQTINPNLFVYYDDSEIRDVCSDLLFQLSDDPITKKTNYIPSKLNHIISVQTDFLGTEPRDCTLPFLKNEIKQLSIFESAHTLTGARANHRTAISPELSFPLLCSCAAYLSQRAEQDHIFLKEQKELQQFLRAYAPLGDLPHSLQESAEKLLSLIWEETKTHSASCFFVTGQSLGQQAQYLTYLINQLLGHKLYQTELPLPLAQISPLSHLFTSCPELLILAGTNDVLYASPQAEQWGKTLKTPHLTSIQIAPYTNHTSKYCTWFQPESLFLESWDLILSTQNKDPHFYLTQPTVQPLYPYSCSIHEFLISLISREKQLVTTSQSQDKLSPDFFTIQERLHLSEQEFNKALTQGYILKPLPTSPYFPSTTQKNKLFYPSDTPASHLSPRETTPSSPDYSQITLFFSLDNTLGDGRYINNAWLQELPDPITKVSWGNFAQCSPKTAKKLQAKEGYNLIFSSSKTNNIPHNVKIPLKIIPGTAEDTLVLPIGYGQTTSSLIGKNTGTSVMSLRTKKDPWFFSVPLNAIKVGDHSTPEQGVITQLKEQLSPHQFSLLFPTHTPSSLPPIPAKNSPHQWGMVIDLSKCIGCQNCVLACRAENNIPIVGREEIAQGRLMDWIRLDRYFSQPNKAPEILFQPVACQHCQKAPCESVCPMGATSHSEEGLNIMTYPRCVGTRYCANNCPYKARRFNFFDYNTYSPLIKNNLAKGPFGEKLTGIVLQHNPQVTVRTRGVMEKCTYCLQRIEKAKREHKLTLLAKLSDETGTPPKDIELTPEQLRLPDGNVQTACQQACPTGAIIFGDLADPQSQVSQLRASQQAYQLLGELGTLPATTYLIRKR